MGGAIAKGLAADAVFSKQNTIAVSNRTEGKLSVLKQQFAAVEVTTDNAAAVSGADIVVLAVKPWVVDSVAAAIRPSMTADQTIVSVVAGVPFSHLRELFSYPDAKPAMFRVIPNTAIAIGESMTVVASDGATPEQDAAVMGIFDRLGATVKIEERLMEAAMALCSCGTAYALRYIRAAMEAGVELGLYPAQAKQIVAQTVKGAADMLMANGTHPEEEIDKVTTPGGFTIKGLNRMEACGFTNAVIEGLKASVK